jgi:hypothetical protein
VIVATSTLELSACLPPRLAEALLARRLADPPGVDRALREPVRVVTVEPGEDG